MTVATQGIKTMTKRVDIHRPSAIDPAEYEYIGVEYDKIDDVGACMVLAENRKRIQAHMAQTGGTYSRHEHGGNCHICGAWAIYTCLFHHRESNVYIRTGFDCAMKMDMGDPKLFRAIKREVKKAREAKAGKQKARAILADLGLEECWTIAKELDDDALKAMGALDENGFHKRELLALRDIVRKLVAYGSLSDGQVKYLRILPESIRTREQREADRDAKRAAERAAAEPVPADGKRHQITGEVLAVKEYESDWGTNYKLVVKDDRGFVVIGGIPRELRRVTPIYLDEADNATGIEREIDRGDRVQFMARLKASRDDPKFGFYSRPTKAELLSTTTEGVER